MADQADVRFANQADDANRWSLTESSVMPGHSRAAASFMNNEAEELFKIADKDGSGLIDQKEFLKLHTIMKGVITQVS